MVVFLRFLLVACLALIGLAAGAWIGGYYFVSRGSGLAGATMALGYGLLGAVASVIAGFVAVIKLQGVALRNFALLSAFGVALIYGALTYRWLLNAEATREPDSAFTAAGHFTVTMERLDTSDPVLFVKMTVNSYKRVWTQTGPGQEYKVCTAKMKAKTLVDIRMALDTLVAMSVEDPAACRGTQDLAIKRLRWDLDGKKGMLDVSTECVQKHFIVARVLVLVEGASLSAGGKIKCT